MLSQKIRLLTHLTWTANTTNDIISPQPPTAPPNRTNQPPTTNQEPHALHSPLLWLVFRSLRQELHQRHARHCYYRRHSLQPLSSAGTIIEHAYARCAQCHDGRVTSGWAADTEVHVDISFKMHKSRSTVSAARSWHDPVQPTQRSHNHRVEPPAAPPPSCV